MALSLYIVCHKEVAWKLKGILKPIFVGDYKPQKNTAFSDRVGDNISNLNGQFCELTAIYWVWKNDRSSSFIGIGHYRRLPNLSANKSVGDVKSWIRFYIYTLAKAIGLSSKNTVLWPKYRRQSAYEIANDFESVFYEQAKIYDAWIPAEIKFSSVSIKEYFQDYIEPSVWEIMDHVYSSRGIIEYQEFTSFLSGNRMRPANMSIMSSIKYNLYCKYLFEVTMAIYEVIEERGLNIKPRTMGYVGELISSIYFNRLSRDSLTNEFTITKIEQ